MSYILDAIKKSEAERNHGLEPGALAGASATPGTRLSPTVIGTIVFLNVVAIAAWFWWQTDYPFDPESAALTQPPVVAPEPPATRPEPVATSPPASHDFSPPVEAPTRARPRVRPRAPEPFTRPASPEFSTHVFANDAEFRSVTLNGHRLTEGDLIEPGMRLITITETGVIVDYHGEQLEFDVLQDWRD